jgi:hypothetical protein
MPGHTGPTLRGRMAVQVICIQFFFNSVENLTLDTEAGKGGAAQVVLGIFWE